MTGVRLVGAVALSTISLVAVMWYLRRKKNDKKKTHNDKSENANCKEIDGRNSLRQISSQPLIVEESLEELTAAIEKQNEKEEETVVEEVVYIQASEVPKLLEEDSNNFKVDEDKIHIDKNLSTLEKSMFSEKPLKPLKEQNEVIHYTNNLDRSPQKASQKIEKPAQSKQNLNLTTEVSENISSENISVLNEAMTSSRMEEVSFINRNESEKVDQELANDPDTLSVSTIVPLMESTNLDITCSQAKDNDIVSDEMIRQESSTKLESSVCHTSQIILTDDRDLNHDSKSKNTKDSPVLENNSNKRNRYDSNCSSHSASHQDDKISETSSDRTASPFKERNSASPSKDFQHAVLENGVQGSDLSSCDSASEGSVNGSRIVCYRCNFPTELCGRLIGKYGKNINNIKEKTGANVALTTNVYTPAFQLCSIEGTQRQVDSALSMICKRFPDVDLRQVDIPTLNDTQAPVSNPLIMPEIMQLNLPEGVTVDVVVSSIVDAGHIFMQQPTHPSFPSLERLNHFMNLCYTQDGIVPQLPRPLEVGVICAAPIMDGWYRAQVTAVYEGPDECDIKYIDYGGFSRVSGSVLRQIRSDFMRLPFQGIECYMANITPLQDEENFSAEAAAGLEELTQGKLLQAQVVGRNEDGMAYCHIYQINGDKVTFVNRELVNRGLVRWIEILS